MSKLTVENVSFVYGDGTPFRTEALDGVSIEIILHRSGKIGERAE